MDIQIFIFLINNYFQVTKVCANYIVVFLLICKQCFDSYYFVWLCVCLCALAQFIHAILVRKTQLLWRIKMNLIMLYRSCNSTIIYSCRRKLTVYCFTSTNCNCLSWQLRKITSINIHVFGYYFLAIICKTFMSVLRAQMRVIWRKIHYLSLDVFCSVRIYANQNGVAVLRFLEYVPVKAEKSYFIIQVVEKN